jgi:hypothetical protein
MTRKLSKRYKVVPENTEEWGQKESVLAGAESLEQQSYEAL